MYLNDIPMKLILGKLKPIEYRTQDLLVMYVLDKEKLEHPHKNYIWDYGAYKVFRNYMDKHCIENGVVFHEWGRPERPVSFPLSEDIEKYNSV